MQFSPPGYVYIATSEGITRSFVGVSKSLLDMERITKFGVDALVWFEGYTDMALALARAEQLSDLSEDERRNVFLRNNPDQSDLSARIWGSDPEET